MATLDIVICTLNEGICQVPACLLPPAQGVSYIVSMQYEDARYLDLIPQELTLRADVRLLTLEGRGLCRNRNYGLAAASSDYVVITDDDVRPVARLKETVEDAFARFPDMDIALFRITDYEGHFFKRYPDAPTDYETACRMNGYYPCSCELVLRRDRVAGTVAFDTRFGLGSGYLSSGEEDVFLEDARRAGLCIQCVPHVIVRTDHVTTGTRLLQSPSMQRSKGAAFLYRYGLFNALWRTAKEFAHYLVRGKVQAGPILWHMLQGMHFLSVHPKKTTSE